MQATKRDALADRRRSAIPGQPIVDPADWTAQEMTTSDEWCYELTAQEIEEMRAAVAPFDREGVDVMPLTRADFPLPTLGDKRRDLRVELLYGRGFGMIRGLPVDDFGKRATTIAFWAVGQYLGDGVLSQNKHGHVLGRVTDIGEFRSTPSQRGPFSREEIPFHVDCSDIVGPLWMEVSKFGGESSLVSSFAVYNEMLTRRPDLAEVLS